MAHSDGIVGCDVAFRLHIAAWDDLDPTLLNHFDFTGLDAAPDGDVRNADQRGEFGHAKTQASIDGDGRDVGRLGGVIAAMRYRVSPAWLRRGSTIEHLDMSGGHCRSPSEGYDRLTSTYIASWQQGRSAI